MIGQTVTEILRDFRNQRAKFLATRAANKASKANGQAGQPIIPEPAQA